MQTKIILAQNEDYLVQGILTFKYVENSRHDTEILALSRSVKH